jgi:hypothetical protein
LLLLLLLLLVVVVVVTGRWLMMSAAWTRQKTFIPRQGHAGFRLSHAASHHNHSEMAKQLAK